MVRWAKSTWTSIDNGTTPNGKDNMHDLSNSFKRILQDGGAKYGAFLGLPDGSAAEIAAGCGFDWLLIDQEHGPFELSSVLQH